MNHPDGRGFDSFERDYYERLDSCLRGLGGQDARYYNRLKTAWLLRLAARRLGGLLGRTFVDLGCGVGYTEQTLHEHGLTGVGLDLSEGMVRAAARAVPQCPFVRADNARLPFSDGAFDLAFSITVMHHLDDRQLEGMIREGRRVIRPGGLAVHFDHNPYNPLARRVAATCDFDVEEKVILRSRRRVAAAMRDAGLTVVDAGYLAFFPAFAGFLDRLEPHLRFLPLGAQYFVAGTR